MKDSFKAHSKQKDFYQEQGSYGQEKSGFGGPEVRTNNNFDKSQDKSGK